ncbi:MAG TPA: glycosyltransferase [Prolixibacteraceae bacterium]|nr:glycosyltransferase [Prolixibacteraceae bacterium]
MSGWPWNNDQPIPKTSISGEYVLWPKISIVTPSFNQAQYLEEAIRSVLLQGYPNLEYIIMDGGSTDGSVEIIKKYEPWLTYWVSKKDKGQASAINKGFSLATGELAGWLNSDDIFFPLAFETIASWWVQNGRPDDLITGTKLKGNSNLETLSRLPQQPFTVEHLIERCIVEQPSTFFTLRAFKELGGLDLRYQNSLDYDLWLRMTRSGAKIHFIDADFAVTRVHPSTKTSKFQHRACRESLLSVWRNYRIFPKAWVKKWATAIINPERVKIEPIRIFLVFIRNLIYYTTYMILQIPVRLHRFVGNSSRIKRTH